MNENVVPARIREARVARGYSLSDLSVKLGVSSQAISQYELGLSKPSSSVMLKMIEILDFPLGFFRKPKNPTHSDLCNSAIYFRSMKTTAKKLKEAAPCRIEWLDEICQYLRGYIEFPQVDLPKLDDVLKDFDHDPETIEEIALLLRKYWGIEKAPINNIVELLQEKGFVISRVELGNEKIDSFSQWYKNVPYIILGSDKHSASRSRFDIAHELGHLILHPNIDQESMKRKEIMDQMESEANQFASAFLLPRDTFPSEVMSTALEHFILLKKRWKVSIQAMVYRCRSLELFTESQSKYLFAQISKNGYRKREPLDDVIPIEKPYLFKQAFELLIENNIANPEEILNELALNKTEIDNLCFLPEDLLTVKTFKPKLTLIKTS
jgi:Zn-dependent peptidase ImmA (M78 family)/DNA-binding XRE family transcriptional regulator